MMNCPFCKTDTLTADTCRCPECGKRLLSCPNNHLVPGFAKFCPVCGEFLKSSPTPPRELQPVILTDFPNSRPVMFFGDFYLWDKDNSAFIIPCADYLKKVRLPQNGKPLGSFNNFGDFKFGILDDSSSKFIELEPGILVGEKAATVAESDAVTAPIFMHKANDWFIVCMKKSKTRIIPHLEKYPASDIDDDISASCELISVSNDGVIIAIDGKYYSLSPDKPAKAFPKSSIQILGFVGDNNDLIASYKDKDKKITIWDVSSNKARRIEVFDNVLDVQLMWTGKLAFLKRDGELFILDGLLETKLDHSSTIGSLCGAWYDTLLSFSGSIARDSIQAIAQDGSIMGNWQLDFDTPSRVVCDKFGFAVKLKKDKWAVF